MGRVLRCAQQLVFCMGTLLMVTGTMYAQDALPIPAPSTPHYGIPEDWSTQHVIYTRNGSVEDMLKVRDDPRFLNNILLHYIREHRNQTAQPATAGLDENRLSADSADADSQELPSQLPRNWRIYHHPPHPPGTGAPRLTGPSPWVDWAAWRLQKVRQSTPLIRAQHPVVPTTLSCTRSTRLLQWAGKPDLVGLRNLYSNSAGTGYCHGHWSHVSIFLCDREQSLGPFANTFARWDKGYLAREYESCQSPRHHMGRWTRHQCRDGCGRPDRYVVEWGMHSCRRFLRLCPQLHHFGPMHGELLPQQRF